ncbi:hypothetical protein KEM55_007368 [Ascosphaera atra]|nr:hypothetical protein KEM55_007368 [Ascosphaera atra]
MADNLPTSLTSVIRWLQRKNYQYEVTFAVYMLTPTEKAIFNTLIITLFTLLCTATYFYFPNFLIKAWQKVLYYCMGEVSAASSSAAASASNMASSIANSTREGVMSLSGGVGDSIGNLFMQRAAGAAADVGQKAL